jgi:hypothetical protein
MSTQADIAQRVMFYTAIDKLKRFGIVHAWRFSGAGAHRKNKIWGAWIFCSSGKSRARGFVLQKRPALSYLEGGTYAEVL